MLKEVEGLSLKELEKIYKVNENALKVRLFQGPAKGVKGFWRTVKKGEGSGRVKSGRQLEVIWIRCAATKNKRLDALFRAYRDACPTPEASANFMPNLWQRIESRQSFTFSFQRMANALVTAAVALSIVLGVYMSMPHNNPSYVSRAI